MTSTRDTLLAAGAARDIADAVDVKERQDDAAIALKAPIANPTFTGQVAVGVGGAFKTDGGIALSSGGAATLNKMSGKITTQALTTVGGGDFILTLTNDQIAATDIVLASVANGTNTGGDPLVEAVTPAAGSVVVEMHNNSTLTAFNGTLVLSFLVVKQ